MRAPRAHAPAAQKKKATSAAIIAFTRASPRCVCRVGCGNAKNVSTPVFCFLRARFMQTAEQAGAAMCEGVDCSLVFKFEGRSRARANGSGEGGAGRRALGDAD